MKTHEVLTGKIFDKLTVIGEPVRENNYIKYECLCSCGKKKLIYSHSLTSGKTTSCGCYRLERLRETITKHGMSDSRFYQIWEGIIRRSRSSKQKSKQITYEKCTISDSWLDFINFRDDMYDSYLLFINKYNMYPEIDKDILSNDKHYSKETCIWVSPKTNRAESTLRNNGYKYTYDIALDILKRI